MTQVVIGGVTYQLTKVDTITTDTNGIATFTKERGIGLYFVKENLATSTSVTVVGSGEAVNTSSITPSAPFFVTLPMTNPTDLNSWMYDVRVYPKNQTDSITKTVKDKTTVHRRQADQLHAELDHLADREAGLLLPRRQQPVRQRHQRLAVDQGCYDHRAERLRRHAGGPRARCDYFYWLDSDASEAGSQLKIAFTDAGLTKLQTAKTADTTAQVVTVINGTVASVPESGVVPNQGSFIPSSDWYYNNGGRSDQPVTPPTDEPNKPTDTAEPRGARHSVERGQVVLRQHHG